MTLKDHYKTMELSVLSSPADIKRAYRRLARSYHPDINNKDENATSIFQEIQMAYEILSNPARRKTYDNELRNVGQYSAFSKDHIVSSEQIVKQSNDLYRYIQSMRNRSINYDALTDFLLGKLNDENMKLLLRANNSTNNEIITTNILQSSKGILAVRSFSEIAKQLEKLHPEQDSLFRKLIINEIKDRQSIEKRNKLVPYAAILIVILIIAIMCLIVF